MDKFGTGIRKRGRPSFFRTWRLSADCRRARDVAWSSASSSKKGQVVAALLPFASCRTRSIWRHQASFWIVDKQWIRRATVISCCRSAATRIFLKPRQWYGRAGRGTSFVSVACVWLVDSVPPREGIFVWDEKRWRERNAVITVS